MPVRLRPRAPILSYFSVSSSRRLTKVARYRTARYPVVFILNLWNDTFYLFLASTEHSNAFERIRLEPSEISICYNITFFGGIHGFLFTGNCAVGISWSR